MSVQGMELAYQGAGSIAGVAQAGQDLWSSWRTVQNVMEARDNLGAGRGNQIPWSSTTVCKANTALEHGATSVTVSSRSEAEELFLRRYQGEGYRNVTDMSPAETKNFFGSKAGVYHWDFDTKAFPHDMSHLQVHTRTGQVIRIFFP